VDDARRLYTVRMNQGAHAEIIWNLRGRRDCAHLKLAVMNYLGWIEPAGIEISAVNTLVERLTSYTVTTRMHRHGHRAAAEMIEPQQAESRRDRLGGAARANALELAAGARRNLARDIDKARCCPTSLDRLPPAMPVIMFVTFELRFRH